MRATLLTILCIFVLGGMALGQDAKPESVIAVKIGGGISAETKHIVNKINPPEGAVEGAIPAEVDLQFPEFRGEGEAKEIAGKLNATIRSHLLGLLEGKKPDTLEALSEAFAADYHAAIKGGAQLTGGWWLKFEAPVKYSDDDLLALELLDVVSTGGAHGDAKLTNQVFSLKTGEAIALGAVIPAGKMAELNKIAEPIFRQAQGLKPDATFADAGFTFAGGTFAVNGNFLISPVGLTFTYNPTEIAPYAKGMIELVIPWKDLKALVVADGPAGKFIAER